ncbi:SIR2 family protein [Methylobacter sp.]|uniref:SIR2 family protein n=1 Tax=Methylobacter sp. TaxID=2051955 RepID=UPI002FDC858C
MNKQSRDVDSIYIRAYKELVTYLKALFIYYNDKINVPNIDLSSWGWCKYLVAATHNQEIEKIHIVTLNYDVWLERVLKKNGISFTISNFEPTDEKIIIYKPHGSISFAHNISKVKDVFKVDYNQDIMDGKISEFVVNYEELTALNSINAMVPPAGDSNRLDFEWASEIRKSILNVSKNLKSSDELIICGTSYWHVDRLEIDSILTSISADISDVKVVNPNSPEVFNAVITTLFTNVKFFKDSSPLA